MGKFIDMTGWVMSEHGVPDSRLTVKKQAEDHIQPNGAHVTMWLCECSCEEHNIIEVSGMNIRNGNTLSCGCISRERFIKNNKLKKKCNVYSEKLLDKYGEYYVGYTSNTGTEFYIDADDYDKVKKYCWCERHSGKTRTIRAYIDGTRMHMHQFLGFADCDHADRNELNNRKYNLRLCTRSQNCQNRSKHTNNTSGFIGVSWHKTTNKWAANINVNKKRISLGVFTDKEEAIRARLFAESKYFKEFAPQRHLFEKYGITVDRSEEN